MIDPFWPSFIDWHLRTEHAWDSALHLEAIQGYIRGELEALARRVWRDVVIGSGEPAFTGLRSILRGSDPS